MSFHAKVVSLSNTPSVALHIKTLNHTFLDPPLKEIWPRFEEDFSSPGIELVFYASLSSPHTIIVTPHYHRVLPKIESCFNPCLSDYS